MTDWEVALEIANKVAKCAVDERNNQGMVYRVRDYAAPMICAALERAAAQERERCAKMLHAMWRQSGSVNAREALKEAADAIRSAPPTTNKKAD